MIQGHNYLELNLFTLYRIAVCIVNNFKLLFVDGCPQCLKFFPGSTHHLYSHLQRQKPMRNTRTDRGSPLNGCWGLCAPLSRFSWVDVGWLTAHPPGSTTTTTCVHDQQSIFLHGEARVIRTKATNTKSPFLEVRQELWHTHQPKQTHTHTHTHTQREREVGEHGWSE